MNNKAVKHPCKGCVYFNACGDNTRTAPCQGRKTKSETKKNAREDKNRENGTSMY